MTYILNQCLVDANIPCKFWKTSKKGFDKRTLRELAEVLSDGDNLLIQGVSNSQKTKLACLFAISYILAYPKKRVLYVSLGQLTESYFDKGAMYRRALSADLLVIDNIYHNNNSGNAQVLQNVWVARRDYVRQTVFTSRVYDDGASYLYRDFGSDLSRSIELDSRLILTGGGSNF